MPSKRPTARTDAPKAERRSLVRNMLGTSAPKPVTPPAPPAAEDAAPARGTARRKVSLYLPDDLVERMRNAVMALAGPPEYLTLTDLGERALDAEVSRLERQHNGGKPFAQRPAELRGGRRVGR